MILISFRRYSLYTVSTNYISENKRGILACGENKNVRLVNKIVSFLYWMNSLVCIRFGWDAATNSSLLLILVFTSISCLLSCAQTDGQTVFALELHVKFLIAYCVSVDRQA